MPRPQTLSIIAVVTLLITLATAHAAPAYKYLRTGAQQDRITQPEAGYALMGGGQDLDEAFRFLCTRAHGGDFLILRATGKDDYNPYVAGLQDGKLCQLNSVATLILPTHESASGPNAPFAAETIHHAEAIFIAGGDQSNYTRNWTNTPVQLELNAAIARGVPIGGTSAGLAVLGEWAYSAEGDKPDDPNLDAKTALADPLGSRITLTHNFLNIPILKGIITDTHFTKRNRMGRLLVFLANIQASGQTKDIHGLGIDQETAVLVDPDGQARVVGRGAAYLVQPRDDIPVLTKGMPLDKAGYDMQKVSAGHEFNIKKWCCGSGPNVLVVERGVLRSRSDLGPVK